MLRVEQLRKSFGKLTAVSDISFEVEKGSINGLIGPNGSGKTTTFNLVSGFLKPSAGDVQLEGRSLIGMAPHRIAALGLVRTFQLTSVYNDLSVRENVLLGHHLRRGMGAGGDRQGIQRSADEIIDLMELTALVNEPAKLLPAGLQRMLSVATALATSPKLLLLDEPLAGLNPTEKAGIVQKLRTLRERGLTLLLVEHDLKSVMSVCEKITVINFGKKIANGTPSEIVSNEAVIKAYIGETRTNFHA